MKFHKSLLYTLATSTLLFAGTITAQEVPVPTPPPATASATATYQTPQGELTVHSVTAAAPIVGPAPSFKQLSGGGKVISEEQADAYPPLANDFLHADQNRNGNISAAEYTQWVKQL